MLINFISATAIANVIGISNDIRGREKQTYIVGRGVTAVGAETLAKKLACMTIGDLDALLQIKDIDPQKVSQLLKDIQDMGIALVCYFFNVIHYENLTFFKKNRRNRNNLKIILYILSDFLLKRNDCEPL